MTRSLSGLVTTQVALAVTLLVAAGLLGRTFVALYTTDTGFDRDRSLTFSIPLMQGDYDDEATDRFYGTLTERVSEIPGIDAAGGILIRPLETAYGYDYPFTVEGRPPEEQPSYPFLNYQAITPGYLDAMGMPLLAGRDFGSGDDGEADPVAIVGAAFADRFWEPGRAVGSRIKFAPPEAEAPWVTIVGVVADVTHRGMRAPRLDVYQPALQSPWPLGYLAVRTSAPASAIVPSIRAAVSDLDPRADVVDVRSARGLVSDALARPRFLSMLLGGFAATALLLGAMGLYGVLAYGAALRNREMGIRMAVGATRASVHGLVVGWGMRLTLAGVVVGLGIAYLARGVAEGQVYGVATDDPGTYAGVALTFVLVALVASWLPARRAAGADPLGILKE